ncbi:hypothetical protein EG329_011786 [Mollisiaceae sp. DMI_Dod_QoI]|nr:hypothetical protein EG329_011786 [Helotiales sp. DMI_Dod_QoI]
MDTLAAIGLVGNIVQFVDFTSKLVSKAREGYRSADGAFIENADLETVTADLLAVANKIKPQEVVRIRDTNFSNLCSSCTDVAGELLAALAKLKVQNGKSKWKSFRKALRSVWSKEEILEIEKRLSSFRDEINLHIVVDLREEFDVAALKQSIDHESLKANTQEIIDLIIKGEDICKSQIEDQTSEIRAMHAETNDVIVDQHDSTRIEIMEAIRVTKQHTEAEHDATRQDISQLKDAIAELSNQIKQKDNELKEILTDFQNTRSQAKKKKLQERGNAASAALLALEVMYRSLISILKSLQERAKRTLQPLSVGYSWRVSPYPKYQTRVTELDPHIELLRSVASSPPLQNSSTCDVPFTNSKGLTLQSSFPGAPAIWIMAIIVSGMSAWPFPIENVSKDRIIYEILIEVFKSTEDDSSLFIDTGSRVQGLQTNINFWKLHARMRGLDSVIDGRFRDSELSREDFSWTKTSPLILD